MGEVDDGEPVAGAVEVHPAGHDVGGRDEAPKAVGHLLGTRPESARGGRRGERVGDVVPRDAAQRRGDLDERHDRRASVAAPLDDPAVLDDDGDPTVSGMAGEPGPSGRSRRIDREEADPRANVAGHRRDERVLRVEDDDTERSRHAPDDRLDLRELGQRVDALEVEVVGRDVRDDRGVVRLVPEAAKQETAPCRLEDRDVHARIGQDHARSGGAGEVTFFDHRLVDEDAVRDRGPRVPPGRPEDAGDHPRRRRLPVRPGDAHGRDAPLRVADPRRRVGRGGGDALHRPGDPPLVIPIRSPRTWVEPGDREPDRGVGDGLGPTALLPRERDDPVPRLGAAMDRRRVAQAARRRPG